MADHTTGDGLPGSADRVSSSGATLDLGDSRDLAAAVRAAWGDEVVADPAAAAEPSPNTAAVPRPPLTGRAKETSSADGPVDPLAHLKGGSTKRRVSLRVARRVRVPTGPTRVRTIVAAAGAGAAVLVAVTVPMVGGATAPQPSDDSSEVGRVTPTPTTVRRSASTTAFTYPAVTVVAPETTVAPIVEPAVVSPPTTSASAPARTATTSRPRSTATTSRPAPKPTQAPTTTQAPPPPPPDDSGDGDGSSEPPPYP